MHRSMTLKQRITLGLAAFLLALAVQIFLSFYQSGTVMQRLDDQMGQFNAISRFQGGVERGLTVLGDYRWEYGDADALLSGLDSAFSTTDAWLWRIDGSLETVSEEEYLLYSAVCTTYKSYTALGEQLEAAVRTGDDAGAARLYYDQVLPCGSYLRQYTQQLLNTAISAAQGTYTEVSALSGRVKWAQTVVAIIDPMLTVGMPPRPSAVVGLDVLCHATENLLGAQQNDYSDMLMLECIKRVWKWLPVVFAEPGNIEGRSQMSWASTNAQANGGVPQGHAIGHAIGAAYGVTHAHACVLVLPSVIRHHAESYPDKIYALADIVGVPTEEDVTVVANRVAKKYVEFYKQFGLTNLQDTLKAAGKLDDEDTFVEKIMPLTLDDFKSRIWNPSIHRPEDHDRLVALLKAIYNEA